ncbi:UNKNOWN [Stylonychia lemnae]|uniref:Uncharacterized protein n=1 Tax=Stylonychia lemnae TaxID=5949 RepID=A0A078A4S9_STYLE|nr:UNKNOWN [Stylonychia lemnae]|eukprot:CDW77182.1 UNKNOWN [Stylonychia lemnae]
MALTKNQGENWKAFHDICQPVSSKLRINYKYYDPKLDENARVYTSKELALKDKEKQIGQVLSELSKKFPISDVLEQRTIEELDEQSKTYMSQKPVYLMSSTKYTDSRNQKQFYSVNGQQGNSEVIALQNMQRAQDIITRTTFNNSFTKTQNSTQNYGRNIQTASTNRRSYTKKINSVISQYRMITPQKMSFFKNCIPSINNRKFYNYNQPNETFPTQGDDCINNFQLDSMSSPKNKQEIDAVDTSYIDQSEMFNLKQQTLRQQQEIINQTASKQNGLNENNVSIEDQFRSQPQSLRGNQMINSQIYKTFSQIGHIRQKSANFQQQNLNQSISGQSASIRGGTVTKDYLIDMVQRQYERNNQDKKNQLKNIILKSQYKSSDGEQDQDQQDNLFDSSKMNDKHYKTDAANYIFRENYEETSGMLNKYNPHDTDREDLNPNQSEIKPQFKQQSYLSHRQQQIQNDSEQNNILGQFGYILDQSSSVHPVDNKENFGLNLVIENAPTFHGARTQTTKNRNNEQRRSKTQENGRQSKYMLKKLVKFPKRLDQKDNHRDIHAEITKELEQYLPLEIRDNIVDLEYLKRKQVIKEHFLKDQLKVNKKAPARHLTAAKKEIYKRLIKHYDPTQIQDCDKQSHQ